MRLAASIAAAELRQQLRSHVFRIVFAVSLLMVVGASAIEALRLDEATTLGMGAGLIVNVHLIWTLFYLFTAAAFVGDAVVRDDAARFAPLVAATPAPRGAYMLGRFAGAFGATLLCFLSVPVGLVAAALLPWADPAWAPPLVPSAYLFALGMLAIPNLFTAAALFYCLSLVTRSLNGCLIGALLLLVLYGVNRTGAGGGDMLVLADPFGFAAVHRAGVGLSEPLAANRLLWLAVAGLLVWIGTRWAARRPVAQSSPKRQAARPSPPVSQPIRRDLPATRAAPAWAVQLRTRLAHELRLTARTPTFTILLLLGLASAVAALRPQAGAPTAELLRALILSFQLVPPVVALFFAGELRWSEQAHRMDGIVGATPTPPALLMLAKFIALALLLLLIAAATAGALIGVQLMAGQQPNYALILSGYLLPKWLDWILFATLALFLQMLVPNKLAGWGLLVLYLIAGLALNQAGLDDPIYRYGGYPGAPFPPELTGEQGANLYRLQWVLVALVMLGATLFLASRRRPAGAGGRKPAAAPGSA